MREGRGAAAREARRHGRRGGTGGAGGGHGGTGGAAAREAREVATAKFWAAEAGHRVARTAVHVHGGIRIDVT